MARRERNTEPNTSTTDETTTEVAVTDPPQEASDMTATIEETVAPDETVPAEPTEAPVETEEKADEPIDLTAFEAAVESAAHGRDEEAGDVPAELISAVQAAYREIKGGAKGKNAGKRSVEASLREAMDQMNIGLARAYMLISDSLASAGSTPKAVKEPKEPADPTEAFVQRVAALTLAYQLTEPSEGVSEDWEEKVATLVSESTDSATELLAWYKNDAEDKGDAPETSPFVTAAVKLALGKSAKVAAGRPASTGGGSSFDGPRRSIATHILEAFEGQDSGAFLSIAEIRKFRSNEYGDNPPSAGAISARLFPTSGKCSLEGVIPGKNADGNKGATKA